MRAHMKMIKQVIGEKGATYIHNQLYCEKICHLAPLSSLSSPPQMNHTVKSCPQKKFGLQLKATATDDTVDIGLISTKERR